MNTIAKITNLTPDKAQALLDNNADNRKLSQTVVKRYANDIAAGRWVFNGEPIIVADDGALNDGQHRCAAVVMANRPIKTFIVFGVPREARFSTDMGIARTAGSLLAMAGMKNSNEIARAAALLMQVEATGELHVTPTGYDTRMFTKQAVVKFAQDNIDRLDYGLHFVSKSNWKPLAPQSVLTACFVFLTDTVGSNWAETFFRRLLDGANLDLNDPIYKARNRLMNERMGGHVPPHRVFEIILRAWNAFRTGSAGRVQVKGKWPAVKK